MNNILCAEFNDSSHAQQIYKSLRKENGIRILEFGQENCGFVFLLAEISENSQKIKGTTLIENPHPDLLRTYFKTFSSEPQNNLCVLESQSIVDILLATNHLMRKENYLGIEIYRGRNSMEPARALLCNGNSSFPWPEELSTVQYKIIPTLNNFVKKEFF